MKFFGESALILFYSVGAWYHVIIQHKGSIRLDECNGKLVGDPKTLKD